MLTRSKNLVFVCAFDNIHSRNYISYFASKPEKYIITVISSTEAASMENVKILFLNSSTEPRKFITKGIVGHFVYNIMQKFPQLLVYLRMREYIYQIHKYQKVIQSFVELLRPDIIHAFRMQPEVIVAADLKDVFPNVPFVVTTWGQDFILFTRKGGAMHDLCRKSLEKTDLLLPDNERDERLAKQEFNLNKQAICCVMPATGGVDFREFEHALDTKLSLKGRINLLSMRGYENSYVRIHVLIKTFAEFVKKYPDSHLYIDASSKIQDLTRDNMVMRWIRKENLESKVTLLHLTRSELFQYMSSCDIYVSATISDGLPMSLVEALYLGMIPVVVDHESTKKIIAETRGGITYQTIQTKNILNAWEVSLEYLHNRNERVFHNQQIINQMYNRNYNLNKVEGFYEELVNPII